MSLKRFWPLLVIIMLIFLSISYFYFRKNNTFNTYIRNNLSFIWNRSGDKSDKIKINNYNPNYVLSIKSPEMSQALITDIEERYNLKIKLVSVEVVDYPSAMVRKMGLSDGRTVPIAGYAIPNSKQQLDQNNDSNGHEIVVQLYLDKDADQWLLTNHESLEDVATFQLILGLVDYASRDPLNLPFGEDAINERDHTMRSEASNTQTYLQTYLHTRLFDIKRN